MKFDRRGGGGEKNVERNEQKTKIDQDRQKGMVGKAMGRGSAAQDGLPHRNQRDLFFQPDAQAQLMTISSRRTALNISTFR